jgi:SAM-dependent methyltransferase
MDPAFQRRYRDLEDWHWWFIGRRRILLRLLDRYLTRSDAESAKVLDVGCGSGAMLVHLSRFGRPHGVDVSSEAVSRCQERGLDAVVHEGGPPLPFAAESFDLITALDVIEHVDDDGELLQELRRLVRPGGRLLVTVPAFRFLWGPHDEINGHRRRYTARELRQRLVEAGWSPLRVSYFNTFLFPAVAAIRVLRPRQSAKPAQSDFELTRPGPLNALLARAFSLESPLVARFDLRIGVSVLTLAQPASPSVSGDRHRSAYRASHAA